MTRYITLGVPLDGGPPQILAGPEVPRREQMNAAKQLRHKPNDAFKEVRVVPLARGESFRLTTPAKQEAESATEKENRAIQKKLAKARAEASEKSPEERKAAAFAAQKEREAQEAQERAAKEAAEREAREKRLAEQEAERKKREAEEARAKEAAMAEARRKEEIREAIAVKKKEARERAEQDLVESVKAAPARKPVPAEPAEAKTPIAD